MNVEYADAQPDVSLNESLSLIPVVCRRLMPVDPPCYPPHWGCRDSPPLSHRRLLSPVGARHRWSLRGKARVSPQICSWRHCGTFILECAITNSCLKLCTGPLRALPWTRSTEACNLAHRWEGPRCRHCILLYAQAVSPLTEELTQSGWPPESCHLHTSPLRLLALWRHSLTGWVRISQKHRVFSSRKSLRAIRFRSTDTI
jgi:hypothetical protein